MKNKDGIELEVGQTWKTDGTDPTLRRILALDEGDVIYRFQVHVGSSIPSSYKFTTLILTACGADLEKARADGWQIWVPGMPLPNGELGEEDAWSQHEGGWTPFTKRVEDWGLLPRRYKLKPQAPPIPEHLELQILRGVDKYECTSLGGKTVGVNEIRQAMSVSGIEYDLIGFKYAESRHMSIFGPTAWWRESYDDGCVPISHNSLNEGVPIFATHAIYLLTK